MRVRCGLWGVRVFTLQQAGFTPAGFYPFRRRFSRIRFRIQWTEFSP
jgi:hypothetical protein